MKEIYNVLAVIAVFSVVLLAAYIIVTNTVVADDTIIESGVIVDSSETHILCMLHNDSPGFDQPMELRWQKLETMKNWTVNERT